MAEVADQQVFGHDIAEILSLYFSLVELNNLGPNNLSFGIRNFLIEFTVDKLSEIRIILQKNEIFEVELLVASVDSIFGAMFLNCVMPSIIIGQSHIIGAKLYIIVYGAVCGSFATSQ